MFIFLFFHKTPNKLFLTAIFWCRPVIMCVIISTNVIIANFIWYFMSAKVCDMTISCCNLKVKWQISKSKKVSNKNTCVQWTLYILWKVQCVSLYDSKYKYLQPSWKYRINGRLCMKITVRKHQREMFTVVNMCVSWRQHLLWHKHGPQIRSSEYCM